MRWISILLCSAALAGGATGAQAQPAPSKAPQGAAHLVLPPVPKALLPDSFAGWVAAEPLKKITDAPLADPANTAALKEYDFSDAVQGDYKRGGETLSLLALSRRQRSVRGVHVLSPVGLAQGTDRHGRNVEQEPGAVLGGQHRGGCEFLAHRAHVGRGVA